MKKIIFCFSILIATTQALLSLEIFPIWEKPCSSWKQQNHFLSEKEIIIIIPSYKNAQWYSFNLSSICAQNYDNFHVFYIDDCSPDGTAELVEQFIKEKNIEHRFTLIKNKVRVGALENLYNAIHACHNDSIIITVDGDDWLACNNVLKIINEAYHDQHVWLTYGQFIRYPSGIYGCCDKLPQINIQQNDYRHCGGYSHLRTFYAGLFKKIKKEDLCKDGKFYSMSWDVAMMAPMLEMAQGKFAFIPHVLYVYNQATALNDDKIDAKLQWDLDVEIRKKTPYQPIARDW